MTEDSIDRPSRSGPPPAEGFPSNPVALVRWQTEVNSVLPPAQEIDALERTIPQAGERLLRLVEREAEHRQVLEMQIGGIVGIGVTAALVSTAFRVKKES